MHGSNYRIEIETRNFTSYHTQDNELITFEPFGQRGGTFVNVDMTTKSGML